MKETDVVSSVSLVHELQSKGRLFFSNFTLSSPAWWNLVEYKCVMTAMVCHS